MWTLTTNNGDFCVTRQREWPGPCMGFRDWGLVPALTFILGWPQASHSPSACVVVPSINEDARLHGLKIPFMSGIPRFCEVSVCSFVAHLKTTPYPRRSTRGRYDPCVGPAPDQPITMVSNLREERGKTGPSPCLPRKVHGKKTRLKLSLRPRIDKGSSVYWFWSHISSLSQMRSSPFTGQGSKAQSIERTCFGLLCFQWWTQDLISSSPLIPLAIFHWTWTRCLRF